MNTSAWLLLVTNLPGRNQTLRMRVWRGLKATGAASLRDGVYVLPNSAASHAAFEQQGREIQAGGGSAHMLPFDGESP
ncbi:MAG TPA: Chromate resistance protein ChrB, partial [Steroidobacteraceae bacterium]|nr:Chromate resistance protein ChrB [Steroidobacteraceae bacterium]